MKPDVFAFLDYRKYLKAYYEYRKSIQRTYSYRLFARVCGCAHGFLFLVLKNKRNLSDVHARDVAKACELNQWETEYFINLVAWNQCEDESIKSLQWERLLKLMPKDSFYYMTNLEEAVLARWYAFALIEMVRLKGFKDDPEWISKHFLWNVSPKEIEETMDLLKLLGFIKYEDGRLCVAKKSVVASKSEVSRQALIKFHTNNIPFGAKSIESVESDLREISTMSVALTQEQVAKLKRKINDFQFEIAESSSDLENADAVYQLNIQFFPLASSETRALKKAS